MALSIEITVKDVENPAAGLIDYYTGNKLVLINKSATARDTHADLVIHEPIGQVFMKIR